MTTIVKGTELCISANGRKRHLKDAPVTGEGLSSRDNQLHMGCESHISYVGGSGTAIRFLLWDARLMAEKQKSRPLRNMLFCCSFFVFYKGICEIASGICPEGR